MTLLRRTILILLLLAQTIIAQTLLNINLASDSLIVVGRVGTVVWLSWC